MRMWDWGIKTEGQRLRESKKVHLLKSEITVSYYVLFCNFYSEQWFFLGVHIFVEAQWSMKSPKLYANLYIYDHFYGEESKAYNRF